MFGVGPIHSHGNNGFIVSWPICCSYVSYSILPTRTLSHSLGRYRAYPVLEVGFTHIVVQTEEIQEGVVDCF